MCLTATNELTVYNFVKSYLPLIFFFFLASHIYIPVLTCYNLDCNENVNKRFYIAFFIFLILHIIIIHLHESQLFWNCEL